MAAADDMLWLPGEIVPDADLPAGEPIGLYVVERLIARGGHGAVYQATHRVLRRGAAIKVLRRELADSPEMLARFVREARVVNRIRHPDIVDIFDLGTLPDGRPYCVMELLEGRGLDAVVRERAPLPPAAAVALVAPVCRALQAAHEAGVVHRDVKASNVMVLSEGDPPRVKLLDFGIAKAVEPGEAGLTATGQRLGTAMAMSPEQIAGHPATPRADVYALGVLLFQLLTGRAPFVAPEGDELDRMHLEARPPRASQVVMSAAPLDAVVDRCLEKSPARRWPSAAALLEALEAAVARPEQLRREPALAVGVRLRPAGEPDEAALADQADAADLAEAFLTEAGFRCLIATAGAILAVQLLPASQVEADAAVARAEALAGRLRAGVTRPALEAVVRLWTGDAEVRSGPDGVEVVGGAIWQEP
jgi:serine/threonine-protein kinase